jgi:hypothetical protein
VNMFDGGLIDVLIFIGLFMLVVWAGVSILRRR